MGGIMEIDTRELTRLQWALNTLKTTSVKFAQRNTINDMAFDAMRGAKDNIRNDFINRNTWTERSVKVNRARRTGDYAEVGSTEEYMRKQEMGGDGEKYNATGNASGEGARTVPRKKAVRPRLWINKLHTTRLSHNRLGVVKGGRRRIVNRKQANIIAVKQAKDAGARYVVQDRGFGKVGLYRVFGTKRKPRTELLYRLRRDRNRIKTHMWLQPAAEQSMGRGKKFYFSRMEDEMARLLAKYPDLK